MKMKFPRVPAILRDPLLYVFLWESFGFLFAAVVLCGYAHGMSNGDIDFTEGFAKALCVPPLAFLFLGGLRLIMPRIFPILLFLGHFGICACLAWNAFWALESGMERGNFAETFWFLFLLGYFSFPLMLIWFEIRRQFAPEFAAVFRFFSGTASAAETSAVQLPDVETRSETPGEFPADGVSVNDETAAPLSPLDIPEENVPRGTRVSWSFEICVFLLLTVLCAWFMWFFRLCWFL